MYGSILFNCWAALIGFTIYFLLNMQNQFLTPLVVIIGSLITAAIVFLCMFIVRKFLHYVFFTPDAMALTIEEQEQMLNDMKNVEELPSLDRTATVQLSDENSEEIANVVRTMMHNEERNLQPE